MENKVKQQSFYVKNKDLLVEIVKYRSTFKVDEEGKLIPGTGKMSDELGKMIIQIANGLAQKPNYSGYTWLEDMKGEAVLTCIKYLRNFNPEKSQNPFAYITTICSNAFIAYITKQKKHSNIKNQLFEKQDMMMSSIDDEEKAINYTMYVD